MWVNMFYSNLGEGWFMMNQKPLCDCSGNAKSFPETVIEHLAGRHGHPRGAQGQAMNLSNWKGWSQNPSLPKPHLRVGSGGKGISCWRSLPTCGLLRVSHFVSASMAAAFEHVLIWCSWRLWHPAIIDVFSIALWHYMLLLSLLICTQPSSSQHEEANGTRQKQKGWI